MEFKQAKNDPMDMSDLNSFIAVRQQQKILEMQQKNADIAVKLSSLQQEDEQKQDVGQNKDQENITL